MIGYIYLTENLVNGKKYVGSHHSTSFDSNYFGSGTLILRAIEKYGKNNFKTTILEKCNTEDRLREQEEYWIRYYNAVEDDSFYNLTYSGFLGGSLGLIGEKHPWYGKHHTEESKRKMRENHADYNGENHPLYGKHRSKETKQKISEHHADVSGENNPNYGKRGELSPIFGRKHTEESRKHMSDAQRLRYQSYEYSEETKQKMSDAAKKRPPNCVGKIWVTNGIQNFRIDPSQLNDYISNGFKQGQTKKSIKNS